MAADVTTLVRILNGYLDEQREERRSTSTSGSGSNLITRDLFVSRIGSKDVDLDLKVPSGFEKRLDLKSGKVYLQRYDSPTTSTSTEHRHRHRTVQDLNFPPGGDESLDLKLVPSYDYRSVCTLDKVKSALERAGKQEKKRSSTASASSANSEEEEEGRSSSASSSSGLLFAGGCPCCLMYVMISKTNPKCPRCNSIVPTPRTMVNKKPKLELDLNLNLSSSSSW